MSQKIQFRKNIIFTEDVTEFFPHESIHKSLESLLQGTELNSEEYIGKYFEKVSLTGYLQVSKARLEKALGKNYIDKLKYKLFDPQKTIFFMMEHQVWSVIQTIVLEQMQEKRQLNDDSQELDSKLKEIGGIMKDYEVLSSLFDKKMLFANIF